MSTIALDAVRYRCDGCPCHRREGRHHTEVRQVTLDVLSPPSVPLPCKITHFSRLRQYGIGISYCCSQKPSGQYSHGDTEVSLQRNGATHPKVSVDSMQKGKRRKTWLLGNWRGFDLKGCTQILSIQDLGTDSQVQLNTALCRPANTYPGTLVTPPSQRPTGGSLT